MQLCLDSNGQYFRSLPLPFLLLSSYQQTKVRQNEFSVQMFSWSAIRLSGGGVGEDGVCSHHNTLIHLNSWMKQNGREKLWNSSKYYTFIVIRSILRQFHAFPFVLPMTPIQLWKVRQTSVCPSIRVSVCPSLLCMYVCVCVSVSVCVWVLNDSMKCHEPSMELARSGHQ